MELGEKKEDNVLSLYLNSGFSGVRDVSFVFSTGIIQQGIFKKKKKKTLSKAQGNTHTISKRQNKNR